jgi:hypothetical protein
MGTETRDRLRRWWRHWSFDIDQWLLATEIVALFGLAGVVIWEIKR